MCVCVVIISLIKAMDVHLDANMDNIVWKIANTAYFPFPYHQWKEGRTRMARIKIKTIPEWLGLQQMSSKSDLSSPRLVALARQADSNCSPIWLLAKRKKGRFMPLLKALVRKENVQLQLELSLFHFPHLITITPPVFSHNSKYNLFL